METHFGLSFLQNNDGCSPAVMQISEQQQQPSSSCGQHSNVSHSLSYLLPTVLSEINCLLIFSLV